MNSRSHLDSLPPYVPIEPFEVLAARSGRNPGDIIKLDANENPYGPLPAVREALGRLDFPHIYPDPESRALRGALARFTGAPAEHLLAGAGADELIDLLMRVLLEPGDRVLICPPTFGMYEFDAHLNSARPVEAARYSDFALDPAAIAAAVEQHAPKLLFLATPNNPDGSIVGPEILNELLKLPLIVVLDEAYIEFAGPRLGVDLSRIDEVSRRENLVVLRTFSKWAGLAGLRVGYGVFPGWLMPALWKAKQPYNVNVAASTAAQISLEYAGELAQVVACLQAERERMYGALQAIPFLEPYPSRANFVLCRAVDRPAAEIKERLAAEHGIFVRYFNKPRLTDYVRISVGRPQDTDALLSALKAL